MIRVLTIVFVSRNASSDQRPHDVSPFQGRPKGCIRDVRIYLRCGYACVPKEALNESNVYAAL